MLSVKSMWSKTNYFITNVDSLYFEVNLQDSLINEVEIYNTNEFEIEITSVYNSNTFFDAVTEFPILVPAKESRIMLIKFAPDQTGVYQDVLTINSDINNDTLVQRIAQQVYLIGNATEGQGYKDLTDDTKVMIYPNPIDEELVIEFPAKNFKGIIQLYNIYGQKVIERAIDNSQKIELNTESLAPGVYFVYLNKLINSANQCYKIIKN